MRDLPKPPPDVVRITATWDVNTDVVTTGWWLFAPGADVADYAQLNTLLGDFFFTPLSALISLVSSDTSVVLLRCVTFGASGIIADLSPAPNAGTLDGSTALNAAMVLTWRTGDRFIGSKTHTWLPLSRSNLGADKRRLSALGYAEGGARAIDFLNGVNGLTSPDGARCVLVAVHRAAAGAPLPSSTMSPVLSAKASPIVGTLQRRTASAPRAPSVP